MNRRGLLKGMGAAAAASLWPGWLSEAFAGAPCAGGALKGVATLSAAIQRAHAALQPLLIFVITKNNGENWLRGQHFGEYLNHGSDLDLAPLACASVVCAEMDAVRQLFPSAPKEEVPAALVADVERAPARIGVAMRGFTHEEKYLPNEFPPPQDAAAMSEEQRLAYYRALRREWNDQEDERISTCIRATGAAIRAAVLDDSAAAKRRADATWNRLTEGQREAARQILAGGEGTVEEVLATAPVLSVAASERSGDPRLVRLLADAARARYRAQRVPGSKWGNATGCGETIEGEEDNLYVACGMGHVPPRSSRFLYFYTLPPNESQE